MKRVNPQFWRVRVIFGYSGGLGDFKPLGGPFPRGWVGEGLGGGKKATGGAPFPAFVAALSLGGVNFGTVYIFPLEGNWGGPKSSLGLNGGLGPLNYAGGRGGERG